MNSSQFMDIKVMDLSSTPQSTSDFVDLGSMNPQEEKNDGEGGGDGLHEIIPSYDFKPIRPLSDAHPSNLNNNGDARAWNSADYRISSDNVRNYSSLDSSRTSKALVENNRKIFDTAIVSEIDQTMKKHSDNLLHALDGVSARLSQLESRTKHLECSLDDLKISIGNNQGTSDGKMRQLENILTEVQTGVENIRDRQEILEAHFQVAELQGPKPNPKPGPKVVEISNPQTSASPNPNFTVLENPSSVKLTNQFHQTQIPPSSQPEPYFPSLPQTVESQNHHYQVPPNPQAPQNHHYQVPSNPQTLELQNHHYQVPSNPQTLETQNHHYQVPPNPQTLESQNLHCQVPQNPQTFEPQNHHYQTLPKPQEPPNHHYPVAPIPQTLEPPNLHYQAPQIPLTHEPSNQRYQVPQIPQTHEPANHHYQVPPIPQTHEAPNHHYQSAPPQPHQSSPQSSLSYPQYSHQPSSQASSLYPQDPYQSLGGASAGQQYYGGQTSRGNSGVYGSQISSGQAAKLPVARMLPQQGSGSVNKVPMEDVMEKVMSMGFSREEVRASVRKLRDSGEAVDLNAVLDSLMNEMTVM